MTTTTNYCHFNADLVSNALKPLITALDENAVALTFVDDEAKRREIILEVLAAAKETIGIDFLKNHFPTNIGLPDSTYPELRERLNETIEFAIRTKQAYYFAAIIAQVSRDGREFTKLWRDTVPHSFGFSWHRTETGGSFIGGCLVYLGKLEDGSSPETFSVRIGHEENPWSLHT